MVERRERLRRRRLRRLQTERLPRPSTGDRTNCDRHGGESRARCSPITPSAGRVTRIAVQRFQRRGQAFSRSVAPSNSFVMLASRSFFPPNTRVTPSTAPGASRTAFRGLPVDLAAFQAPAGIAPRLHRICPPGQVVLHLRHQKRRAPCARGRRHGARSVGWRLRLPRTRPRARPRVLHPTTGRHRGREPDSADPTACHPPCKGLLGSRNSCTVLSGRRHTHADCGLRRHGQE